MKGGVVLLLLIASSGAVHSFAATEQGKIDSLKRVINQAEGIEKANPVFELAKLYIKADLDSSKLLFEQALSICRKVNDDTTMIKLLCRFQPPLSDVGEQELARHYLVMARDAKSPGAQLPKFRAMVYRAFFNLQYWYFTNYDSCVHYSLNYAEVAADSTHRAEGYILLGASYNELGDNIKALESYNTAQSLLQSPRADLPTLAHLFNNLGMLYSDELELKKSEEYYLKAVEYAQASKVPAADLAALNNLGLLYNWQGDYEKSLEYLAMAAERLPAYNSLWADANNLLNVASTLTLSGKPAAGLEKYKQSMVLFSKLKDNYTVALLHLEMAAAYRLLGKNRDAEREALQALEWDGKEGYGELVKNSYKELSSIYGATRQFDKAYDYQARYLTIVDSLNSADRKTKFGLLEKNFEILQQERVREQLKRENTIHVAQAEADRTTRIALIAGTIILAAGVVLATMAYRRSRAQKQKIEEQAQQLQEAAKTKSRFFANVSHELRTPVTLLNGMLELMQENPARNGTDEKMEIALESSRRLQRMLNEVLDLSRVEAGKWELSRKQKEVQPLLNRIVLAFESLMVKKQLRLEYDAKLLNGLVVDIDEDKFEKVINNLVYNAIKFNHEGGWIRVTADRTQTTMVIQVADSGIGIPEKELPHIFDRFYQSASTEKLNAQGIGIGLSLVREFTELHSGKVSVTSQVNEGSCFTVEFPITGPGTNPAEPIEEVTEAIDVTFEDFAQKPKVLVVEDNDEMRFYLKEILGEHVSMAEARHGREGLKWLKSHQPDIIISDVMMPEMDGYEFLSQLKGSSTHRGIPVVMLTARAAEEDMLQGLSLGVDDYIIKPFNAKELKIRIHNLLTNRAIRKEWGQKPEAPDEVVAAPPEDQVLIEKVRGFVEENAENASLGIAELGDHLAMSERQVYRKIGALVGMTPAQLIKEIRLKIAYRLLLERKVTKVSALANRVGFENTSYFSRQFLERYGKRPAEFL